MSDTTTAIFLLTDGTTVVNFLDLKSYRHVEWNPAVAELKGGGTWRGGPLAEGRRLAHGVLGNIIESITFQVYGSNQDKAIASMQRVERLLQQARNYWSGLAEADPVWIEVRAACESNSRYALIYDGKIANYEDPFGQPFFSPYQTSMQLVLSVERGQWLSEEPGTGRALDHGVVHTFNGRSFGAVDEDQEADYQTQAWTATHTKLANLTHVFVDDGGIFGANLLDATLPYYLLPAIPAVDDAVYFGISTAVDDYGPFCSLIFDIQQSGLYYEGEWQYYDTAAVGWETIEIESAGTEGLIDNTAKYATQSGNFYAFQAVTGVLSVHWNARQVWGVNTINGVEAYWVRFIVTAVGASPVGVVQGNRNPYTVSWPYLEISASELTGDLPNLLRNQIWGWSSCDTGSDRILRRNVSRLILGSRRASRGESFNAFLNFSQTQQPDGVEASRGAGVSWVTGFGTSPYDWLAPTGSCMEFPTGAGTKTADIDISSSLSAQYQGKFRVFVRVAGDEREITVFIGTKIDTFFYNADIPVVNSPANDSPLAIVDCGIAEIPDFHGSDPLLRIRVSVESGDDEFYLVDVVLMPIDELSLELYNKDQESQDTWPLGWISSSAGERDDLDDDYRLLSYNDLDEITSPKEGLTAQLVDGLGFGTGHIYPDWSKFLIRKWLTVPSAGFGVYPNEKQRIWILQTYIDYLPAFTAWHGDATDTMCCLQHYLWGVDRYQGLRGNR